MKIVCIIQALVMGGAERQLFGLAVQLKEKGHDVTVMTYRKGDFFRSYLEENRVPVVSLEGTGGNIKLVKAMAAYFRDERVDAVISFVTGPNTKTCMAKMLYPGFKLVVSERNFNTSYHLHDRWRFLFYRKADRIITNSYAQADFIRRHFPAQAAKLGTIVNFVDLEKYHPAADSGSGPQTYRIVSTARVSKRKNLSALIYAVAHARQAGYDVRADWYGCVKDTKYLAFCQAEIARLGLDGLVEVHPETQDVASAYRKADICCLPSYYEGTPNALIEAMACGLPAFVSDVSDNARYCIDGRNGFTFNPADNDSVAAALMKLLALGKEGLKAFGAESRRIAEEKLSKERFIGEWLDVLEKL